MKVKKFFRLILAVVLPFAYLATLANFAEAASISQNFSDYIEVDPNNKITVGYGSLAWSSVSRNETAMVYHDFGTDYFSGNLTVTMEIVHTTDNYESTAVNAYWAMSNNLTALDDFRANGDYSLSLINALAPGVNLNTSIYLMETFGGSEYTTAVSAFSVNATTHYVVKIVRDESIGTYGTLYAYIYDSWQQDNLLATQTLTLHQKANLRYNFGFISMNTGEPAITDSGSTILMSIDSTAGLPEAITVETSGYSATTIGGQTAYILSGVATANFTFTLRGFQIGLADGIWEETLKLEQFAVGSVESPTGHWLNAQTGEETPYTDNSTSGSFALSTTLLSANTTHYYRAFAGYFSGSWIYYYGDTRSFVTTTGVALGFPILTTDTVWVSPITGELSVSGTLISSSLPVIERGFRFGLSADMATYSSTSALADNFPTGYFVRTTTLTGAFTQIGITIYVQVFATNNIGNVGVGNIVAYTIPDFNIGIGGLRILNNAAIVNGNSATLSAEITNPSNVALTRYGFAWGKTSACSDSSWNDIAEAELTSISYTISGLDATAVYWFKAGVLVTSNNQWYWSTPTAFTTGSTLPFITGSAPVVETLPATLITPSGFQSNGNIISVGDTIGSYVSKRGFAYSTTGTGSVSTWSQITETGNFTAGAFSRSTTVSVAGVTVYFTALATNQYDTSYGQIYSVKLEVGGTSTVPSQPTVGLINDLFANVRNSLGLTGIMGAWAFMGLILLLVALLFGVAYFSTANNMGKTAIAVVWLLSSISVVGAFMFTGQLGVWTIVILVCAVVALILTFVSVKLSGSGGTV